MMRVDEMVKKEIEEDMKKIQVPSSLYNFAKNIRAESESKEVNGTPVGRKKTKKKYPIAAAVVATLSILAGSAFMNPAIAEMAAKIPYLGQVFKTKPVHEMLHEALEKGGYKDVSFGMTPGEKASFDISIQGSDQDADRDREKITKIVEDVLKGKGYDNFTINVSAYSPEVKPLSENDKRMMESIQAMDKGLKDQGFNVLYVKQYKDIIEVDIPITEMRENEIKNATLKLAKQHGLEQEKVSISKIDLEERKRESQWHDYLSTIYEGLALKKDYKVNSYGYFYNKNHMELIIKTSINPSDPNASEMADKIRNEIVQFLENGEIKAKITDDTYKIVIHAKDGKEIAR